MSQTAITLAFENWKAQQGATGEPVLLDEFVFASVPDLNPDTPVDRNETLPPAAQIVHRQSVTRTGVVDENGVVYSVVLGADVGDFSFNWIGLLNKASGTLAMIVHAPSQQKLKTKEGQQGNVLTRSFLMEYNGAQTETGINTPAETWQIDFTARLAGMDERQRLENMDIYGAAAFFGNGYLVAKTGNQFFVTKGTGYVAGLRASLAANQNITVTTKPVKVWLDVCWTGTLTSVWNVQSKITVAANLADYVQNGVQHYVFAVASIDADGNITDLRPKGSLGEQQASSDFLRKDANLADVSDKVKARKSLELGELAVLSRSDVLPVGVPLPWPADIPPPGWAIMQGQSFDKAVYPSTDYTGKLVRLDVGYTDLLLRWFTGYVERSQPAENGFQRLFIRELVGVFERMWPCSFQHPTLREIAGWLEENSGITVSVPDAQYSDTPIPHFTHNGTGYQLLNNLGRAFSIQDYIW